MLLEKGQKVSVISVIKKSKNSREIMKKDAVVCEVFPAEKMALVRYKNGKKAKLPFDSLN